jgi:hypothetical protein
VSKIPVLCSAGACSGGVRVMATIVLLGLSQPLNGSFWGFQKAAQFQDKVRRVCWCNNADTSTHQLSDGTAVPLYTRLLLHFPFPRVIGAHTLNLPGCCLCCVVKTDWHCRWMVCAAASFFPFVSQALLTPKYTDWHCLLKHASVSRCSAASPNNGTLVT